MNGLQASNGGHLETGAIGQDAANAHQYYIPQIVQALELAHNPRIPSESRRRAYIFLEETQLQPQAHLYGWGLAADPSQSPIVRHYGLSLLEKLISVRDERLASSDIRSWIWQLADAVRESDPGFIRNKIAKIWVDVAKLYWAKEWIDMDELLLRLWSKDIIHKEFVAVILESLSEDIFKHDDPVVSLRAGELGRACIDIFTSSSILQQQLPRRESTAGVKTGEEGWLARLLDFLDWCMPNQVSSSDAIRACALKVYGALRSAMAWIQPAAVAAARGSERLANGLVVSSHDIQLASVEALTAFHARPHMKQEDFSLVVSPMFSRGCIALLNQLYEWCVVDPIDMDEDKYTLSKKLAELISVFGVYLDVNASVLPGEADIPGYLTLLTKVLSNQSLSVSAPALSGWAKILKSSNVSLRSAMAPNIRVVLDICSHRLIKFEYMSSDSNNPTIFFLNEDYDTLPDQHSFVGKYRRYCVMAIEAVVLSDPLEAIKFVLGSVDEAIQSLSQSRPPLNMEAYNKHSASFLQVDAQLAVVEAALKGYEKWKNNHGSKPQQDEQNRTELESILEAWCGRLLQSEFEDPLIRKRILQVAVELTTTSLETREQFILAILQHIFTIQLPDYPEFPIYSEAVKDLQNICTNELHRLAVKMPNFLITIYDALESKINEIISSRSLDDRARVSLQTFLFILTQRATVITDDMRASRLAPIVESIHASWMNPELDNSLATFQGCCELVGVAKAQEYLRSRRAWEIKDWSSYQLDEEGKAIQAEMGGRFQQLPLRTTKSFLGASVEKVAKGSPEQAFAGALWRATIPVILPKLLKFLGFSHAYHNVQTWTADSDELRSIASRALSDRFWQSGISSGTKEEFYAKVSSTRTTLDGFASTLRGAVRNVREACYSILFCMSRLEQFYSYDELPEPLAQALCADSIGLSSHQYTTLIAVARYIIDDCPKERRELFLTPLLSQLLAQIDAKVAIEWSSVAKRMEENSADEELSEEMKDESVLRQLTHMGVLLVAALLDPKRERKVESGATATEATAAAASDSNDAAVKEESGDQGSMRAFVLSSVDILRPLMTFCTHVIQVPDSRCCAITVRVLKSICGDFVGDSELAVAMREYMSGDVLRAAITSFHDGRFVDVQRDLITLIVSIYMTYSRSSSTARNNLMALPGVTAAKMEAVNKRLFETASNRHLRGLMMGLLEDVRGMSITEQGKVVPPPRATPTSDQDSVAAPGRPVKARRTRVAGRGGGGGGSTNDTGHPFMNVDPSEAAGRKSPDLSGMADMFG